MIGTAIDFTAVGMTSTAPVARTFVIRSVLLTPDIAESFYFPASPF